MPRSALRGKGFQHRNKCVTSESKFRTVGRRQHRKISVSGSYRRRGVADASPSSALHLELKACVVAACQGTDPSVSAVALELSAKRESSEKSAFCLLKPAAQMDAGACATAPGFEGQAGTGRGYDETQCATPYLIDECLTKRGLRWSKVSISPTRTTGMF